MGKIISACKKVCTKANVAMTIAGANMMALMTTPVLAKGDTVLGYDISTGAVEGGDQDLTQVGGHLQDTGNTIYNIIVALALIGVMGFFVFKAIKLSKSGDNPQERQKAIEGLVFAMLAVALIGGGLTIAGWAFGMFKGQ